MYRTLARLEGAASRFEDLETVCPGWAWPRSLADRLAPPLAEGRPIVVDLRDGAWTPSQKAERRELEAWLEAHISAGNGVSSWR
jgi:hypothetical protein